MGDNFVELDKAASDPFLKFLVLLFSPYAIGHIQHVHGVDFLDGEGHALLVSGSG